MSGTYPVGMAEQPTMTPGPVSPVPAPERPDDTRRPDPLAISVANEVARMRREAGLSERAAARKLGTSQTQLRRMEDPRYLPSLRSLARLAAAYGYRIEVTFDSLDEKKKRPAPAAVVAPRKRPAEPRRVTPVRAAPRKGRAPAPRRDRGTRG